MAFVFDKYKRGPTPCQSLSKPKGLRRKGGTVKKSAPRSYKKPKQRRTSIKLTEESKKILQKLGYKLKSGK